MLRGKRSASGQALPAAAPARRRQQTSGSAHGASRRCGMKETLMQARKSFLYVMVITAVFAVHGFGLAADLSPLSLSPSPAAVARAAVATGSVAPVDAAKAVQAATPPVAQ